MGLYDGLTAEPTFPLEGQRPLLSLDEAPAAAPAPLAAATAREVSPEARAIARNVLARLEETAAAARREGRSLNEEARAQLLSELLDVTLPGSGVTTDEARAAIAESAGGLFGLEGFLDDPLVSDIMVNAYDAIFIERGGRLERVTTPLLSGPTELRLLVDRVISRCPTNSTLTRQTPTFNARFNYQAPYGEVGVRVNATEGSIGVSEHPTLSLRKPTASGFDRLEPWTQGELPPLPPDAAYLLREAFRRRASILLVGGTGSGKTSLLKALLRSTADLGERIIVAEEANELDLRKELDNYVGLAADEAVGVEIHQLIENAMRMRPDRLVVGECRKPEEVMSFLRAVNTGHAGSITTVHASSARDGMQAMLTLAASATSSKSSVEHIGALIARGLDLVVYLGSQYLRSPDGSRRRVRRVLEVCAVGEFAVRDGAPDFGLVPLYLRADDRPHAVVEFSRPLTSRGYSAMSDRGAHFVDRMLASGVSEAELRSWLAPRLELPPPGAL